MSLPLAGKVAIVTGASRGIGASIARKLASDGATVVINYVSSTQAAADLAKEINEKGDGKAITIKADLSSVSEAKRLVDETVAALGQLDILVLNAGVMDYGTLAAIDEAAYDKHYTTNVKVPLFMTQHAAPLLKEGGRILFFSSSLTINTAVPPNYVLYVSTKGAVEQIVRVLAKDLGTKGITVNAIAPGPTDTDLFRNGKSQQLIQTFEGMHPMKRLGQTSEIASVVSFLVSKEATWVNGQTWFVNGGLNV
ncbi:hypothetical protein EUX98_g5912 [Antrodiella citrinella]|uniref:NAD(P)-binding protein n=1 Tax=Antrodiella citrinella TaxID=2447956 RepID=A0A4S4MQG1_9APHY|nr:hypothetical protein EUX98_g5912 [Antrodiella citrinella]